jgi:hypothetical protein
MGKLLMVVGGRLRGHREREFGRWLGRSCEKELIHHHISHIQETWNLCLVQVHE